MPPLLHGFGIQDDDPPRDSGDFAAAAAADDDDDDDEDADADEAEGDSWHCRPLNGGSQTQRLPVAVITQTP